MKQSILMSLGSSRPAIPTRDEILSLKMHFQGLTVNTPTFGILPWWETIAWFDNYADRAAAYSAKHMLGDTHCILDICGAYLESGQVYNNPVFPHDYTNNLVSFRNLVEEVISEGFYPYITLAGDGQSVSSNPSYGQYNDPVGWTYGYQWLYGNFARIADSLRDLSPYVVFVPGYDGVFYGWTPDQVVAFGNLFRSVLPNGYLGIEFNVGHIPLGEGGNDYRMDGRMCCYDLLCGEFNGWIGSTPLDTITGYTNGRPDYIGNSIWQIVARLVWPYNWPNDEPYDADSHPPPFYLLEDSSRGPWYFCAFEYDVYRWVRNQISSTDIETERQYFKSLGVNHVC